MKTIIEFRKVFMLLFLASTLSACLTNVDEEIELDPCSEVTFARTIKPIIDSNCVSCHNTNGQASFLNLESYQTISANASSVKESVVAKRMPQGAPLSDSDIQAISCWVDAGALNN